MPRKGLPLIAAIALFSIAAGCALFLGLGRFGIPLSAFHLGQLAYFAVLTYLLLNWQEQAMHADPKGFVRRFMTGLVLKMLLSLFVVLGVAFLSPPDQAIHLVICFALLYLAYLGFSVARLMRRSKQPHERAA